MRYDCRQQLIKLIFTLPYSCRPVEWPFYFALVLPTALILIFDGVMFARIIFYIGTVEPPIMDTPTIGQPPTNGQSPCPLPTTACTPYIPDLRQTDTPDLQVTDKSHAPSCHGAYIITSQRTRMRQLGFNHRSIDLREG